MTAAPLVAAEGLTVSFTTQGRTVTAVRDVSLSVSPGEVLGVVGESGSGKSATAMALLGLLPPRIGRVQSGRILISGQDMAQAGEAQWRTVRGRQIALVPQDPGAALNPTLTIERQFWLMQRHARNRAEARRRSAECLARIGLGDPESFLPRYPFQLSGGQRQRVLIAAALLHGAGLIIADEPTTALDVTVQAEILTLLKGLTQDSGLGMIFITHSLGVAAQLCDELLVLRQGQVVERGPAAELLSKPGADYTRALLAAMPGASEPRRKLPVESELP